MPEIVMYVNMDNQSQCRRSHRCSAEILLLIKSTDTLYLT